MDKTKLLSILAHASILLTATVVSVGIPIVILIVSENEIVKDNAREALNFHINIWAYGIIVGILTVLTFGLLGFILGPILAVISWVMPIIAIIQIWNNPETPFRYPFIFRLL